MIIREKDKNILLQFFSEMNFAAEVWAYGSRVNGKAHEGSDLDLVIQSANLAPIPRSTFNSLTEKIKNSNIPILVELRDWALLPYDFKSNIEQHHEVLFNNIKHFNAETTAVT